ncbi:hypothetical protein [Agrobacterium sp. NPDC090283]|uniref:hypothetical protein n=1 Tax=Agrobacterium sp. NPDC090283 TaxID=3363920 RepID=UPI00383BF1DE
MAKRRLFIGLSLIIAVVGALFLVPVYPEVPPQLREPVVALNLDTSGDRLLLRTQGSDFEFILPPNRLKELSATGFDRLRLLGGIRVYIDTIRLQSPDAATTKITVMLGGYDPALGETREGMLPEALRSDLETLGFVPSNGNVVGDFATPLYMVWSADLSGRQYPANSRQPYDGMDLLTPTLFEVLVLEGNDPALERNRQLNSMLRPLIAVREGVETAIFAFFMKFSGANPAPGG